MIAVIKAQPAGFVNCAMPKGSRYGAKSQRLDSRFVGNPSERYDGAKPWHAFDGRQKKRPAVGDFRRKRLVLRRHATDRVDDAAIDQRQAVVGAGLIDAFGETIFDQGGV